MFQVLY